MEKGSTSDQKEVGMQISIGVVGAGEFSAAMIPLFQAHPGVSEVRLADLLPDRLAEAAARHGITRTYPSMEALCASDVDAIAIFTQRWTHGPLVLEALAAGKHVYSAVPMASQPSEIEAIVAALGGTDRIYMMGETSYYNATVVYCREKMATGDFGRVIYAEGDYVHDMDHGFYTAFQRGGGADWKSTASYPPMMYPTHALGGVLGVLPTYCTSVSCLGMVDRHEDGVFVPSVSRWQNAFSDESALFETADGLAIRTNEFRRVGYPTPLRESRFRFFGTDASFEQLATVSLWQDKKDVEDVSELVRTVSHPDLLDEQARSQLSRAHAGGFANVHDLSRLPDSLIGLGNGHEGAHPFLADDFVRACLTGQQPPVNAWTAARFTMPGLIAHESARQGGKRLDIPDFGACPA
jgi:predicted dehydrogenase